MLMVVVGNQPCIHASGGGVEIECGYTDTTRLAPNLVVNLFHSWAYNC